ncbi:MULTISPECIES: sterol desaturase family protein [unclassified Polaribacter]|jgi:beta-carotene 3-hydroxylase|uniref:sterol desaturase family protein n=1 Tax=unclassified Polaribacter TaxID=196858 RepID=UPI001C4EB626|nr:MULTISPECIES: sterol desaturase family protein [unclassified Polaribacter]QXP62441.1 sterol desaturase family protein [Polaribacter sp. HaHaR_3_91]QXP68191.1 sterol desaturase family protein [Polaribacter sp. AHE13PA]
MIFVLITLGVFLFMECVTWCTHKFVMHGFGWYLHADHHQPKYQGVFEKNDAYFIVFAIPSILLFYFGTYTEYTFLFFIGLGILFYGIAYFLVHDVLIHQRFKWFKHTNNRYLRGLRKAHKMHHKHLGKEEGECFGMLFVPFKYFKKPKL